MGIECTEKLPLFCQSSYIAALLRPELISALHPGLARQESINRSDARTRRLMYDC